MLFGGFPIARCRDVYSVVDYLAAHIQSDLPTLLHLTQIEEGNAEWSVLSICESLAARNKWTTHRGHLPFTSTPRIHVRSFGHQVVVGTSIVQPTGFCEVL